MSAHTPGYEVTRDGKVFSTEHNWRGYGRRELTPTPDSDGYLCVRVSINGSRAKVRVHRLVAWEFLPPRPDPFHEIRHLNGDKLDNRAENLAWGTRKDNAADRDAHGRTSRGPGHSAAIRAGLKDALTDVEIRAITRLTAKGWTQRAIAERIGRSQSAVGHVVRTARATGEQP